MSSEPRCCLCSGHLVKEKGVIVPLGVLGAVTYTQAWVCTQCSAAFPIAVWPKGVISGVAPLYADGKRLPESSS